MEPLAFNLRGREEGARLELDEVASLRASEGGSSRSYVLAPSSAASAASTSGSSGPVCASCSSAKPTNGAARCCESTGLMSPATRTWHGWDDYNQAVVENISGTLRVEEPYRLVFSAADSPAKTSPLLAEDEGLPESDRASSSSSPESLTLFSPMEASSSLRTYPDFFPPTVGEISPSFSRRWPSSGFTTSPGECWTADTSECPSGGGASSSLADVLEGEVAPRYFLSPKAAAGILRRAEKRGRELPEHLRSALSKVAGSAATQSEPTRQEVGN